MTMPCTGEGLAMAIDEREELELVGQAGDGLEASSLIERWRPMSPSSTCRCLAKTAWGSASGCWPATSPPPRGSFC